MAGIDIGEKTGTFAVICKTLSGAVYEVVLTEEECQQVQSLIHHMHGGKVRCYSTPLDGIDITERPS